MAPKSLFITFEDSDERFVRWHHLAFTKKRNKFFQRDGIKRSIVNTVLSALRSKVKLEKIITKEKK